MQVSILTGSREAEHKMLGVLEALSALNTGIEARILNADCTGEDLKLIVENSLADLFLIGSSMANTLSAHVANFAGDRPVIGVPLQNVNDSLSVYSEHPTVNKPYAITEVGDINAAAEIVVEILNNLMEARAS